MLKILSILLLAICCQFSHAIEVLFVPRTGESRLLSESEQDSDLCRTRNPLPGLQLTGRLFGMDLCGSGGETRGNLDTQIDLLVLVDDLNGLNSEVHQRLDSIDRERLSCRSSSRHYAFPNYFYLQGETSLRVLVVGEKIFGSYFSETPATEPWQQYLIKVIDHGAGSDASPDSGTSPSVSSRAANNIPVGKGLFQQSAMHNLVSNRYKPYKMDHMASRMHDNGMNWFALTSRVASMCEGRLYTEFIRFNHPNFQFFIWQLNTPTNMEAQVDDMLAAARNIQANGIIIDIEGENSFRGHAAQAREFYQIARRKVSEYSAQEGNQELSMGYTTVGHRQLPPWVNIEDVRASDFLMPQIYNNEDSFSTAEINRRIDFWLNPHPRNSAPPADGFPKPVVLVAGAHHNPGSRPKTAEEFEHSTGPFAGKAQGAIGWWRYGVIESGNHWQRVREFPLD